MGEENKEKLPDPIELENKNRIEQLEKENKELKTEYTKLYEYIRNLSASDIREQSNKQSIKPFEDLFRKEN